MKPDHKIDAKLKTFADLSLYDLRQEWRRLYRQDPPARLSRDLLARGVAYRWQEQARGGLSKADLRRLTGNKGSDADGAQRSGSSAIKPGTRLVRQWKGTTHTVLIQDGHVEWSGRRFGSLSEVARAITGARWSGPRFFGLSKAPASDRKADVASNNDDRRASNSNSHRGHHAET